MIRVMIVDDQGLIRDGLKMILSLASDIEVIGEALNGKEALDLLTKTKPHVILMDIRMPLMDGVQATKIIKERFSGIKVIILTTFNEDEYIFEGLKNGADGYILKDVKSDEIIKAIREIYKGNTLLHPQITTKVVRAFTNIDNQKKLENNKEKMIAIKHLTPRELEISKLVGEGKNNREISKELFITEGTVKNHITRILSKLKLRDRTQLAVLISKK